MQKYGSMSVRSVDENAVLLANAAICSMYNQIDAICARGLQITGDEPSACQKSLFGIGSWPSIDLLSMGHTLA
jgi:hypothetical protein